MVKHSGIVSLSIATALSLGFAPSASASPSSFVSNDQQRGAISQAVSKYANQIADSFFELPSQGSSPSAPRSMKSELSLRQSQLAKQNGPQTFDDPNLVVTDASVKPEITSIKGSGDTTTANVNLETDITSVPKKGVTLRIAGHQESVLHSSSTDSHVLTLQKAASDAPYVVTKDEALLPAENTNETQPLSSSEKQAMAFVGPIGFDNQVKLNYIKEIQYAEKWTSRPYARRMNPAYPTLPHNCTNFASQAVHEGGLPEQRGLGKSINTHDLAFWTWRMVSARRSTGKLTLTSPTSTWDNVNANYWYMLHRSGSFRAEDNPRKLYEGSLLYGSWRGPKQNLSHAMIVVGVAVRGRSVVEPILCGKDVNRHDMTFSAADRQARNVERHPHARWYGLQYYNAQWK